MKEQQLLDDRDLYLALNHIFRGESAAIRNVKPIQQLIQKHKEEPEVAQLLQPDGSLNQAVCSKVRDLLKEGVFQDRLKAKSKFPTLFEASPEQTADNDASEAEAATDQANAVRTAIQGDLEHDGGNESDDTCTNEKVCDPTSAVLDRAKPVQSRAPWLFPLRLPFATGHKIMVRVQQILEKACFEYATEAMPEAVKRFNWHCAESVELNVWIREFKRCNEIQNHLYDSIRNIRHTAVHRLDVTAKEIENFIINACVLARMLDEHATLQLECILQEVQRAISEMMENKAMLESKLSATLSRIEAQRAELDLLEEMAKASIQHQDNDYRLQVGFSLLNGITKVEESERKGDHGTVLLPPLRQIYSIVSVLWTGMPP